MKRRALVTGATGFIGTRLCSHLVVEGWSVHTLVRPKSNRRRLASIPKLVFHECDGRTPSIRAAVAEARPAAVFHLASLARQIHQSDDVAPMVEANITLGSQLLEGLETAGCDVMVNAGTYSSYDLSGAYRPDSLYAATKRAFERIIDFYSGARGIRATTLVLFDVYGEGDWRDKLIPSLFQRGFQGVELAATPGEQRLDFVHVDDVVKGLLLAADRLVEDGGAGGHTTYALDSGTRCSLRELVARISSMSPYPPRVNWGALPYRPHQIMNPVETIDRLPGWSSKVSLDEGLRRVLADMNSAGSSSASWTQNG